MQQLDLLSVFIDPLEQGLIDYMVTGSVASTLYGEPRLTHDIDIVVILHMSEIEKFRLLFPDNNFYCPPAEVIRIELSRRPFSHFNLVHHDSGYKADCYPFTGDPLHSWAFKRRRRVEITSSLSIWVAPPEYVIVRKLQYFRNGGSDKHLSDIRKMLQSEDCLLDREELSRLIEEVSLKGEWKKLHSSESNEAGL